MNSTTSTLQECVTRSTADQPQGHLADRPAYAPDQGLSDELLLRICGVPAGDPQITPAWKSTLRLAARMLGEPWLPQGERPQTALTLLASVLGKLTQYNPRHLPFGYNGPQVRSHYWIERERLEAIGKQIVGLMWSDRLPQVNAFAVENAVSEAVRVGFLDQRQYDAWRPGMPSGSGWRRAVTATPYGLARARSRSSRALMPPLTPENDRMPSDTLLSNELDDAAVALAVREFRRAMWEYTDSRDWVQRLSAGVHEDGDDLCGQERATIRAACGDRNTNARARLVNTVPIILLQAEESGLDTRGLKEAIARNPLSETVLRKLECLVDLIEERLKTRRDVRANEGAGRSWHRRDAFATSDAVEAKGVRTEHESHRSAPDDRYEWACQVELVRAVNQVVGQGMLNKGVLSRACATGQVETNGKPGRAARVRVRSFLAWVTRRFAIGKAEEDQVRNAVIGEITSRMR